MNSTRGKLCQLAIGASLLAATTSCGHHDKTGSASANPSYSPSATSSPGSDNSTTARPKGSATPSDPVAPSTYLPVTRNGKRPHPTFHAATKPFTKSVSYSDGVSLHVTRIQHGEVSESGPGVVRGPVTIFTLELVNDSGKSISLNHVVPTTTYGSPARESQPEYNTKGLQDFRGTVKPGDKATAKYGFMIPSKDLGNVGFVVDFDAIHAAATFHGTAENS